MLALGFDQSILAAFNRLLRDVISAVADVHVWTKDEDEAVAALYQAVQDTATALSTTARALTLQAADGPGTLDPLLVRVDACQKAIDAAEDYERERQTAWRELPADDPQEGQRTVRSNERLWPSRPDLRHGHVDLLAELPGGQFVPAPDLLPDRSGRFG